MWPGGRVARWSGGQVAGWPDGQMWAFVTMRPGMYSSGAALLPSLLVATSCMARLRYQHLVETEMVSSLTLTDHTYN